MHSTTARTPTQSCTSLPPWYHTGALVNRTMPLTQAHDLHPCSASLRPFPLLKPLPCPFHICHDHTVIQGPEAPTWCAVEAQRQPSTPHTTTTFPVTQTSALLLLRRQWYSVDPHLVLWRSAGRELHGHLQPTLVGGGGGGGTHLHLQGERQRRGEQHGAWKWALEETATLTAHGLPQLTRYSVVRSGALGCCSVDTPHKTNVVGRAHAPARKAQR